MKQLFTAIAFLVAISVQAQHSTDPALNAKWDSTDALLRKEIISKLLDTINWEKPIPARSLNMDSLPSISQKGWGMGYVDNVVGITKWDDGRFEIHGDTLKAIQLLWNRLDEAAKRESDLWELIDAAIDFTNHVPDYWKEKKNNPAWSKYAALLRKHGYIIRKKK